MSDLRATISDLFEQSNHPNEAAQTAKKTMPFISREMLIYKLMQMIDSNLEKDKQIAELREVFCSLIYK